MTAPDLDAMRARDRLAVARLGDPDRDPLLRAEMDRRALLAEVERLAQWKAEAMEVLSGWECVWEALDMPGALGQQKSAAVLDAVQAERQEMALRFSRANRRADEAEAQVQAVRALHVRGEAYDGNLDYCERCIEQEGATWPCETVRAALDGTQTNGDDR